MNQGTADEKTRWAFERTHGAIRDSHGHSEKNMADTLLQMAELLDTVVDAECHEIENDGHEN